MLDKQEYIKYVDNINVVPINNELKYICKLKYNYQFKLTNTNVIITFNLNDLNKVFSFGIIQKIYL